MTSWVFWFCVGALVIGFGYGGLICVGCVSGFSFVVAFVGVTGSVFLVFWVWV